MQFFVLHELDTNAGYKHFIPNLTPSRAVKLGHSASKVFTLLRSSGFENRSVAFSSVEQVCFLSHEILFYMAVA